MAVLILILLKIAPIFLILLLGYATFSLKWVDESFIGSANRLVYYIALPALIFLSILGADFRRRISLAGDSLLYRGDGGDRVRRTHSGTFF